MTQHQPLPVHGYTPQGSDTVGLVNTNKVVEEKLLRILDDYRRAACVDQRWLAVATTHIEQGFMALNRAVFKPSRIKLEGDA